MKIILFLAFVAVICIKSTLAYDFSAVAPSGQTLYYKIIDANSHTVSVTYPNLNWHGFTKPTGDLVIPSNVAYSGINYSVISIGESSFRDCSGITSVTLPTSLDSIIQYAFWGCSSITDITIPLNITFLESKAFAFCDSLSTINYNAANCITGISSYYATYLDCPFYGCNSITAINIGNNVQSIPDYLFYSTGITTLTIPENVTSIGASSFGACHSLTTVNYNAINCSLSYNIYTTSHSPFVGCNNISTINIGNSVTTIPNNMFEHTGITTLTIPSSVTQIGDDAFKECTSLQSLYFNATNCQTASGSFYGCTSLSSVTMSGNVHRIPNNMFIGTLQTSGTSINIPNSVNYIGNSAFNGCSGITGTLVIPTGVTYIGSSAFHGCSGITGTITIPSGITKIRPSTFYNCTGLTGVVIPSSVRVIDTTSFSGCSNLTSVTIGANVDSLRWGAFTGCSSLTTINYQTNGVVEQQAISSNALTQFNIGSNVQRIPNNLIYNCPNLTFLILPNSLTYIGQLNFMSCGLSGNLVLPASITEIGVGAFSYCTGLDSIKLNATTPPLVQPLYGSTYIFSNCWNKPLCVPCESISTYQSSAGWNNFTNITCNTPTYTVTVNSNNTSMGTVTGGGTYEQGATVQISAIPNNGYHFERWSDNNTQNPRNITVNNDITLTAFFAANAEIDDIDDVRIIVYAKDYQIHIDGAIGEPVTIYTLDGRMVASLPRATTHVAIPITNTGVYIVKICDHFARKVVVLQ